MWHPIWELQSEEYTTGRYKGMNKFEVMAVRNIPVVRSINRVLDFKLFDV